MQVVYPYKKSYSQELKWSVESLRNVLHDGVFVIGDMPKDFIVNAGFAPPNGPPVANNRSTDQINRYKTACELLTTEDLLLMNDDFFIMQPWTPQNYNRGSLDQHIAERRANDLYKRELVSTNNFLKKSGLPNIDFELHIPMLVKRELLLQAIKEIEPELRRNPILIRSYYGNRFGLQTDTVEDVKNPQEYKDMVLLSTSDTTFVSGPIGAFIQRQLS